LWQQQNQKMMILVKHVKNLKNEIFKGSENHVLDRFYEVSKIYKPKNILRITSDCFFIDPSSIDYIISYHLKIDYEISSNSNILTFANV